MTHDKRINEHEIFQALVENAVDFLKNSISEIEKKPKYSVINFCSGVEIFLKSRLLKEHWSLIVTDKDVKLQSFLQGNSNTVGTKEALNLLKNVIETNIPRDAEKSFMDLIEYRNRLIHFFHKNDNLTTIDIVSKQCRAWYHLHNLLSNEWKNEFSSYQIQLQQLNELMLTNERFLKEKFELVGKNIQDKKAQGITFIKCEFCHFDAAQKHEIGNIRFKTDCLVCNSTADFVQLDCAKCGYTTNFLLDDGFSVCENCKEPFSASELLATTFTLENLDDADLTIDYLVSAIGDTPPYSDDSDRYYCLSCQYLEEPSVVYIDEEWQCVNCQTSHQDVRMCEWCGEPIAGYLEEDTYTYGCNLFCDGSIGYQISKDD